MTPAPAAPLPIVPFLPVRPMPMQAPTSPPFPQYAGGFGEILADRQQANMPVVGPDVLPISSVEPTPAPATASVEPDLPVDATMPDLVLPEAVVRSAHPAPERPVSVQGESSAAESETQPPSAGQPTVEPSIRPDGALPIGQSASVANQEKPPVSRDLPTAKPTPPKTPDVSRVLPMTAQTVALPTQPGAKRDTPVSRRIDLSQAIPPADGMVKQSETAKNLWTALMAQSQAQPAQDVARTQDTAPAIITGQASTPFETIAAAKPGMAAQDIAQISDRVLDVARGNAWIDQIAADISAAQKSDGELNFRLIPARLGQLDVQIATRDAGMELQFSAQTDEAASIVAAAQPRLVEELRNQGIRVAGSEVGTAPGQSGQNSGGGQQGHAPRQQPTPPFDQPAHRHSGERKQAPAAQGRFA